MMMMIVSPKKVRCNKVLYCSIPYAVAVRVSSAYLLIYFYFAPPPLCWPPNAL